MDHTELSRIIQSNHRIRQIVQQATDNLLSLQDDLLQKISKETFDQAVEEKSKPLIDKLKIRTLTEQMTSERAQLVLVGENSCGKTSLIHLLLGSDPILPADVGPVSARIIRLTYGSPEQARLNVYDSIKEISKKPREHISLTECFTASEPDWNAVRSKIKPYVERPDPKNVEKNSPEFAKWAERFVKIFIPSDFLKLGIDLYDSPGLLYSDPPVLKQNLHNLVKILRPAIVFMYENSSVSDDTRDCFLAVKEALGKQLDDISIFFLNTKADIGTFVPEDMDMNEDEFEKTTLSAAREKRKELLLKISSMAQDKAWW